MSNITLSAAVRSNLLSLQNTATLLDTTQTRLATGNKVNSALDNPTSYFTASALNSRASDLGNLLDSVSNAVQTIQAANDGITSITKLVESAQATAQQAQQLSETSDVAATAGTVSENAFSTLNISGTGTAASAGSVTGTGFAALNVSGVASAATITGGANSTVDLSGSNTLTFNLTVNGTSHAITLNSSTAAVSSAAVTGAEIATAINLQVGSSVASFGGGHLTFTSPTTGAASNLTIGTIGGTATNTTGIAATSQVTGTDAASESFTVTANGGGPQTVTLSKAIVDTYNTNNGTTLNSASLTNADVRDLINSQITGATASVVSGQLKLTSTTLGGSSSVQASTVTTAGGATGTIGLPTTAGTGTAASNADAISFSIALDGGSAQNVTLNAASVTSYNTAHSTNLSATNLSASDVANLINDQLGSSVASVSSGHLAFTSATTGSTSSVAVSAVTSQVTGGASGITAGTNTGTASSSGVNPARGALISQYNGLLDQINQLTADAGYNGNNLLAGSSTQLKVVFNETGTSNLTVTGKDASATGLGLTALGSTAFDSNTSITSIISTLKTATDTLRSDASSFGSNLSIVQTRQDFTKAIINTLQTGASNLTLADSNEEAANLLALQTRQSLSTKALSLASQSDQNVLRLLQ